MPDAGRAGGRGRVAPAVGVEVAPATMPSAMPYSSGSAPATTPPVRLMCSTPGTIGSALRTIVADDLGALLEVGRRSG